MSRIPQFSVSGEEFIDNLIEENKKLREENEILRCSRGGTPEKVGHEEFIQYLMGENKKLKEELGEYKKMFEDQLKEVYIKNTAEFLDKKFPAINGFIEEDTLQELRDLGEI